VALARVAAESGWGAIVERVGCLDVLADLGDERARDAGNPVAAKMRKQPVSCRKSLASALAATHSRSASWKAARSVAST
jgi:hypothetical protein